jgi:hypothetical protein
MIDELHSTGFSSCLWCDLRLNVCRRCTPSPENEFIDVETFSNDVVEVQKDVTDSAAATGAGGATSQVSTLKDRASPDCTGDLERTLQRSDDPVENLSLIETHEELPEGQDPSPSVVAFNESFSTSFRGEWLSVSRETTVAGGGAPKLFLLWKSPKLVNETGEGVLKKKSLA